MNRLAKEIRRSMLEIAKISKHGHLPTCFSVVEMLIGVYQVMRRNPKDPFWEERDIFILSKGHASLGLYCVLAQLGYFDFRELDTFGAFMSKFGGHPDRLKVPGVEASTGSLGHGIGLAVGMALAFKLQKSDRKVYVLIGDGEANEGTVWESILVAVDQGLNNLVILYDNNLSQSRGLQIYNPAERFRAFGMDVSETDGHDLDALKEEIGKKSERVRMIVANTVKGYGCKTFVEEVYVWHRKAPTEEEYQNLLKELDEASI